MGGYVFSMCLKLKSVTIGTGLTAIEDGTFYNCTDLAIVNIGKNVSRIGNSAFYYCDLKTIEIPEGVTTIGDGAFAECYKLTSVTIPNSVITIGSSAFSYCYKLSSVTIPNSVTTIGASAFSWCETLTSIEIPSSVTSIGSTLFEGCKVLATITVAPENSYYDSREDCNAIIETATNTLIATCNNSVIPCNVTSIGMFAFTGCTKLTSVTIPQSVTSIGVFAFLYCEGLTSITSLIPAEKLFEVGSYEFYGVDKTNCTLYVPKGAKSTYETTGGWSEFANIVETDLSGIEDGEISTAEIKIMLGDGIEVSKYYGTLRIVNLSGQVIKDVVVNGSVKLNLPKGVYIVVTDNNSQKVIL